MTSLVLIGINLAILTQKNPLRLLVPSLSYPFPTWDRRDNVPMFGIDRESGQVIPGRRKVSIPGDPTMFIERIAFTLSMPPILQEGETDYDFSRLDTMPNLGLAIKHVWIHTLGSEKHAIIDLRSSSLDQILKDFLKDRDTSRTRDKKYYLSTYFRALTFSILRGGPDVSVVQFTVDGETVDLPGMEFALSKSYNRHDLP